MRWRWIAGGVLLAIAVLITFLASPSSFTIHPSDDVSVECTRDGGTYVDDDGEPLATDDAPGTAGRAASLCGEARADRERTPTYIAIALALAALGVMFFGPIYTRAFDRHPRTVYRGIE